VGAKVLIGRHVAAALMRQAARAARGPEGDLGAGTPEGPIPVAIAYRASGGDEQKRPLSESDELPISSAKMRSVQRVARSTDRTAKRLKAEAGACEVCGWREPMGDSDALHAHHVVPLACGGSNAPENYAVLCPNHHALAHRVGQVRRTGVWSGPKTREVLIEVIRRYEHPGRRLAQTRRLIESLRESA
jgi:hypothetical protein